jgi:hypothetical protein
MNERLRSIINAHVIIPVMNKQKSVDVQLMNANFHEHFLLASIRSRDMKFHDDITAKGIYVASANFSHQAARLASFYNILEHLMRFLVPASHLVSLA